MPKFFFITGAVLLFLFTVWLFLAFASTKTYPVNFGISFNQNHAASLGLNWKDTYLALLEDLHPQYIRIAAMWSEVEKEDGIFDYSDVDWMMNEAQKNGAKVLLVVGQKAPRWPECHVPSWVHDKNSERAAYVFRYIQTTVLRYANHPALEFWQVENEPFIRFAFGDCAGYDNTIFGEEVELVRQTDPIHEIIVTDSGELSTWRRASRAGDIFGSTLYRVVRTPRGFIFSYNWLPASFYRFKSMFWGRRYENFFIVELQAEPWFTDTTPLDTPIHVQEETMDPIRMKKHIAYARHVGASRAYFWGVEWWYFMKEKNGDARYWDIAKETLLSPKQKTGE